MRILTLVIWHWSRRFSTTTATDALRTLKTVGVFQVLVRYRPTAIDTTLAILLRSSTSSTRRVTGLTVSRLPVPKPVDGHRFAEDLLEYEVDYYQKENTTWYRCKNLHVMCQPDGCVSCLRCSVTNLVYKPRHWTGGRKVAYSLPSNS